MNTFAGTNISAAINQLTEMMALFGIDAIIVDENTDRSLNMDRGLRRFLKYEHDIHEGVQLMSRYYQPGTLYIIKDTFEAHYLSFLLPEEGRPGTWEKEETINGDNAGIGVSKGKRFWHAGPYITSDPSQIVDSVMAALGLPLMARNELVDYYAEVPLITASQVLEDIVCLEMRQILGGDTPVQVMHIDAHEKVKVDLGKLLEEQEKSFSLSAVESRYRQEHAIMDAVRKGDTDAAIKAAGGEGSMSSAARDAAAHADFRRLQDYVITFNTLCRYAAEEAGIHPGHIEKISESVIAEIERCRGRHELEEVSRKMIRRYCLLVQNHSMEGYSPVVRQAVNFIDFHLKEDITRSSLARGIGVNPNYLSTIFRKETGSSVVDYINGRRIEESMQLLSTTDLPIREVASLSGFMDENYYSRVFRKFRDMTPLQYRHMMQSGL